MRWPPAHPSRWARSTAGTDVPWSCDSCVLVAAAPVIGPCGERVAAPLNGGSRLRREADQIANIVQRQQPQSEQLARDEQMTQVSPRIRRARLAVAARVQRPVVGPVGGIANVHGAFWRVRRAVAAAAGGGDTVEQVHAPLYRGDQIRRKPDTHK